MKGWKVIGLVLVIGIIFYVLDIVFFKAVVNSGMPDWLKWMILKG